MSQATNLDELIEATKEASPDKEKTSKKNGDVKNEIAKHAEEIAESDEQVEAIKKLAEYGEQQALNEIAQVAQTRYEIAKEAGREGLEDLDKFADAQSVGQNLAVSDLQKQAAVEAEREKLAQAFEEIEEEQGKEAADDLAKFAFYENVGQQMALNQLGQALKEEQSD